MGHRGRFSGNKILESRCGSFSSERLRSWMQKSRFYLIYLSTSPISHLNAAQGRKVQFLWVIMVLGKFSLYQTQIWSLPTHVTNWLYLVLTDALETWMTWLYINTFMATTVVFYRAGVYWNYILSKLPGYLGCNFQYTPALGKRMAIHCDNKLPRGRNFQFIPTRGSVLLFFFRSGSVL